MMFCVVRFCCWFRYLRYFVSNCGKHSRREHGKQIQRLLFGEESLMPRMVAFLQMEGFCGNAKLMRLKKHGKNMHKIICLRI